MKPFDLGKAKSGYPVCTRDGHKARIVCYDYDGTEGKPIIALIEEGDYERAVALNNNGKLYSDDDSDNDLMMASVIHKKYIVLKKEEGRFRIASDILFPTVELAKCYKRNHKDATTILKIEWEE